MQIFTGTIKQLNKKNELRKLVYNFLKPIYVLPSIPEDATITEETDQTKPYYKKFVITYQTPKGEAYIIFTDYTFGKNLDKKWRAFLSKNLNKTMLNNYANNFKAYINDVVTDLSNELNLEAQKLFN